MTFSILSQAVDIDVAPSMPGEQTEDFIDLALMTMRKHLDMEVAYLSEFVDGRAVFRAVNAPGLEDVIKPGDSRDLRDVYCQHILEGRLPNVIPDTKDFALALSLPITQAAPIGSHVSVPIHRQDGSVFGMFCCLSPHPNHTLNDRDLKVMETFADLATRQLHSNLYDREKKSRAHTVTTRFIAQGQFDIVYQPVFPLGASTPSAFEALCRFHSTPYRPPNEWFEDVRMCGRHVDLELAAIEKALFAIVDWPDDIYLTLNASPSTITSGRLLPVLLPFGPQRLVVEVTEHEMVDDNDAFRAALSELTNQGVRIAIDDVGTGYSGLTQILSTQPDFIKLDMGLVRHIDTDTSRQALVLGLAQFGRAMEAKLIAEGVETDLEYETLKTLGVQLVQGYLLGRPGDRSAAAAWFQPDPCELDQQGSAVSRMN